MKKSKQSLLIHFIVISIAVSMFLSLYSPGVMAIGTAVAQDISYSFSFDTPIIHQGINGYDQVTIKGLLSAGDPGKPKLPMQGVSIPLPPYTTVKDIHITGDCIIIGTGYLIEPGEPLVSFIDSISDAQRDVDEAIYHSDQLYPVQPFLMSGIHNFRGYSVCIAKISPLVYQPNTGTLYFYPRLDVTIELVADETSRPLFRGLAKDVAALEEKYESSGIPLPPLELPTPLTGDNYDLLIITTEGLKSGFIPLADKHNATGIRTRVKTLTDVGGSTPELIREFIKTAYQTDGIEYVLLGGDFDIIPAKGLYAHAGDKTVTDMHSDVYYGCLEGDFDGNGNGIFGESNDSVDLVAEVYVGRACAGTLEEVQHFVSKTISYIDAGIASGGKYIGRVVLAGEKLWDNPLTWGGTALDELVDGSDHNGTITVGIPSDSFAISRLYERDDSWSKSDIIARINNGLYIIDHLGHGSISQSFKLNLNDVESLTNQKYCFVYSQACNSGRFDDSSQDCMAEYLTVKTENGAFAVVMNTREGWYMRGSTDGPSHRYNREFWDAIFSESITNPNMTRFGVANQDSKEDNLYRIDEEGMRWCYYEITFFGDPTLSIYDPVPQPVLTIGNISGGWGIHTGVKNTGNTVANLVTWTIQAKGGFFRLVNKSFDNQFGPLAIDGNQSINTRPFLGIGRIQITVTAGCSGDVPVRRTANLFILGFYVFKLPDRLQQLFNRP